MKRIIIALALVFLSGVAQAQAISTTTCPGAGCIDINTSGQGSIGIQITGTWVGTVTFQSSLGTSSSSTFTSLIVFPSNSTTGVTTTTGNGIWTAAVAGINQVRVVFTAYTSGTANVIRRTTVEAKANPSSGGGGSGTVTSVATSSPITGGPITTTGTIACATCGVTGSPLSQFASTTSAQLAGTISDETGTGVLTFATAPTFTTSIDLATDGVRLSASDGVLTILGMGNGNDENLTIDLDNASPNQINLASGTGANALQWAGSLFLTNFLNASGNVQTSLNVWLMNDAGLLMFGGSTDTILRRDAAGVLAQRNGVNAQTFRLYETFTDASNYERGSLTMGSDTLTLAWETLGTGTDNGNVAFTPAGTGNIITNGSGHVISAGTSPTVAGSCGAGPVLVGTDAAGKITTGTGSPTSCTVTFARAWPNAPACVVTNETTANLARATSTTTTVVLGGTLIAGDVLAYQCLGF